MRCTAHRPGSRRWFVGRGLGSKWWSIEGRGVQPSKAHWPFSGGGEINNLGSDDGAPECLWSLTELPEEGLAVLFCSLPSPLSLFLLLLPFPFLLSAASKASSISKRLTPSVSVRIPLARDVLLMDRRNVMNVAVGRQALQLGPVVKSSMMKWGRAEASTMRSREDSCR